VLQFYRMRREVAIDEVALYEADQDQEADGSREQVTT